MIGIHNHLQVNIKYFKTRAQHELYHFFVHVGFVMVGNEYHSELYT